MRRRTRTSTTAVVAVVAAFAVAGCGGSDATTTGTSAAGTGTGATTTGTSAGGTAAAQGATISIPAATFATPRGWERIDPAATERALGTSYRVRAVLAPAGGSTRNPTARLVVLEAPVAGAAAQARADFPAFKRAYLAGLRAEISGNLEPVERPDVEVDGRPGIVVDVRDPSGATGGSRQIGTVDDDSGVYLQVTVGPGEQQQDAYAALDAVRASWRWR